MVNANGISGNSTNGHLLECASDYEPCSHADTAPQPKWRGAWPMFTHKGGWTDTDGKTHSLTIRRDHSTSRHRCLGLLRGLRCTVEARDDSCRCATSVDRT
jgi:hypothetical protein